MIRRRRKLFGSLLPQPTGTRQSQTFKVFCATTWIGALAVLSFQTLAANAQGLSLTANDDVCGCTSGSYTFELDFGLTCPPTNIHIGSGTGVERVTCLISPFGAPATDLEPISVESISILELDQSNSVLVEKSLEGEFFSGFSFSYTSIINEATSVQGIPKSLQMNLSGKNADGVMLMNVFVITFTNECGVMPVIQAGESAGWVTFTQTSGPIARLCPTLVPSSTPSNTPTTTPRPTKAPTKRPTKRPTRLPSIPITPSPTDMSMSMALNRNLFDLAVDPFDLDRSELSEAESDLIKDLLNS